MREFYGYILDGKGCFCFLADGFSVDLLKEVAQTMKDIAAKIQNIQEGADANEFKNHTELIKEK